MRRILICFTVDGTCLRVHSKRHYQEVFHHKQSSQATVFQGAFFNCICGIIGSIMGSTSKHL